MGTGAQSPINIGKDAAETAMAILEDKDYEERYRKKHLSLIKIM